MNYKILNTDVMEGLKMLEDESIDTAITSPPYWGLRDYGIEGQIGLEKHPQEYIIKLVKIFGLMRTKLKKTGSFYLNMGDTYCGGHIGGTIYNKKTKYADKANVPQLKEGRPQGKLRKDGGWFQEKQLMLMPSRMAIALQEDGWILRNDIIWHKPSHMPSSVKDRLTNSYEHLYHFVRAKKYHYDLDAIRERHKTDSKGYVPYDEAIGKSWHNHEQDLVQGGGQKQVRCQNPKGKNPADVWRGDERAILAKEQGMDTRYSHSKRPQTGFKHPDDFWSINPQPFREAHFAVFPEALCEKPIKASCPKEGLVLDPFMGSGTVLVVAQKLRRHAVGIELKPEYCELAKKRLDKIAGQAYLTGDVDKVEVANAG